MHRLKLLYGQLCIALGEIEAARQLLTDGFATSQQTFGIGDVLTMEFQMTLAEVYIERREIELAKTYLSPDLTLTKSGRSDICAISAGTLVAKVFYIAGSLDRAKTLLSQCLVGAMEIVGDDHVMLWQMWYDLAVIYLHRKDYTTAETVLSSLPGPNNQRKGPRAP